MENILAAHKEAQGDDCEYTWKPEHWHQMLEITWLPCLFFGVVVVFVCILEQGHLGGKLRRNENWNGVSRRPGNWTTEKNGHSHLTQENRENIYLQHASFCGIAELQVALLSVMLHVTTSKDTDLYPQTLQKGWKGGGSLHLNKLQDNQKSQNII